MTILRKATAALENVVNDILGDEITYTPEGGAPLTFNAWVEFDTDHVRAGGSSATARVRAVEVPMSRVPTPSKEGDRITIAIRPGEIFKPRDIEEGAGGETWFIPLTRVRDV